MVYEALHKLGLLQISDAYTLLVDRHFAAFFLDRLPRKLFRYFLLNNMTICYRMCKELKHERISGGSMLKVSARRKAIIWASVAFAVAEGTGASAMDQRITPEESTSPRFSEHVRAHYEMLDGYHGSEHGQQPTPDEVQELVAQALDEAVVIYGDGNGTLGRLQNHNQRLRQVPVAARGKPKPGMHGYMVEMLVGGIAKVVYHDIAIARGIKETLPELADKQLLAKCQAQYDEQKLSNLLAQIDGYIRYCCNPLMAPNDLTGGGRGIMNHGDTCYLSVALQVLARIPGALEAILAFNPKNRSEELLKWALLNGTTAIVYGNPGKAAEPSITHQLLHEAGYAPTVGGDSAHNVFVYVNIINGNGTEDPPTVLPQNWPIQMYAGALEIVKEVGSEGGEARFRTLPVCAIHRQDKGRDRAPGQQLQASDGNEVVEALNIHTRFQVYDDGLKQEITTLPVVPLEAVAVTIGIQEDRHGNIINPTHVPSKLVWRDGAWGIPSEDGTTSAGAIEYGIRSAIIRKSYGRNQGHALLLDQPEPGVWFMCDDQTISVIDPKVAMATVNGAGELKSAAASGVIYRRV
jgi:hypothetical protein